MIMNRREVVKALGLCYTTIYSLEKEGKFPKKLQLAAGRVGWSRAEVEAWVAGLPRAEVTQTDNLAKAPSGPAETPRAAVDLGGDPLSVFNVPVDPLAVFNTLVDPLSVFNEPIDSLSRFSVPVDPFAEFNVPVDPLADFVVPK